MNTSKFHIIIPPEGIEDHPEHLKGIANGDRNDFAWLYKNYARKVFDYALLLTANETMSEDIVHEVFLQLWYKREKLMAVNNFESYLFIVVRNFTTRFLQTKKKECLRLQEYLRWAEEPAEEAGAHFPSFEEKLHLVKKAINQLSPQQKLVFCLRRLKCMKRKQIAVSLGLSYLTVDTHSKIAMRNIRKHVREMMNEIGNK